MSKKTVVFDFDGVIHSYISGWQGTDVANDPIVEGIKELIEELRADNYEVVVVSTRCQTVDGRDCIFDYLDKYGVVVDGIKATKPPAVCYIDDRAIQFKGDCNGLADQIRNFEPWNERRKAKGKS